ncbi:MAG: alginate O-acetyltransferase AlgX-related protein [Cellvibrionaceae bacterium]
MKILDESNLFKATVMSISLTLIFPVVATDALASITPAPSLCEKSKDPNSYRGDFLRSFTGLQSGSDGWLFREQDLRTSFGPEKDNYKHLRQLRSKLAERGVTLVMVPIPSRSLVHPEYLGGVSFDRTAAAASYKQFLQRLRRSDIVVPELERLIDQPADKPMFFARDHHWNHHGARTIARLTAASIRQQENYSSIERTLHETTLVSKAHNDGSYSRAANKLCDSGFKSEPYKIYQTAAMSDDLFGDVSVASISISLVGTSNSSGKLRLNFDGFLSQYAKTGVLNMAESGGGYAKAIESYLASRDFQNSPPRFLVWEFPAYYRLNDESFFSGLFQTMRGES